MTEREIGKYIDRLNKGNYKESVFTRTLGENVELAKAWGAEPINSGKKNRLPEFSHLTKCNAVSGISIPFDFLHPIELILRGEAMIVGSLTQIKNELTLWLEIIILCLKVSHWKSCKYNYVNFKNLN